MKVKPKYFPVIPNNTELEGQKNFEEFFDLKKEKPIKLIKDSVEVIALKKELNSHIKIKKLLNLNSKEKNYKIS